MKTLSVHDFSCITKATIEMDRLTVIIGPQASGKSVLAKLSYFALDCAHTRSAAISRQVSYEKYVGSVRDRFHEWFPKSAWGSKKFRISFSAGKYELIITRGSYKGTPANDAKVKFSQAFQDTYQALFAQLEKSTSKREDQFLRDVMERDWRIRELNTRSLNQMMGADAVQHLAFVPAGRSFFTSVGKAIAAFEESRVLDPLVLRFGKMYAAYRDRASYYAVRSREPDTIKGIQDILRRLLGGKVVRDGEKDYLLADDGRQIPLSALSSGQQELLPIVAILPWFSGERDMSQCFIEEPEAHLFPSTQSALVEALVSAASSASLFLTTHSPYVIVKINNLLKAGVMGRKRNEQLRSQLELRIPKRAWLNHKHVRAYAIQDGFVTSILGKDGLIDGDYLDEVSGALSEEFSMMLDLEMKHGI